MLERENMRVHKQEKYINGKWRESILAVIETENNLLIIVETEKNFRSKKKSKVKIRSKTS